MPRLATGQPKVIQVGGLRNPPVGVFQLHRAAVPDCDRDRSGVGVDGDDPDTIRPLATTAGSGSGDVERLLRPACGHEAAHRLPTEVDHRALIGLVAADSDVIARVRAALVVAVFTADVHMRAVTVGRAKADGKVVARQIGFLHADEHECAFGASNVFLLFQPIGVQRVRAPDCAARFIDIRLGKVRTDDQFARFGENLGQEGPWGREAAARVVNFGHGN